MSRDTDLTLKLVSRDRWAARPATGATSLSRAAVRGIAIHYSGASGADCDDHAQCAGAVCALQALHMSDAVPGGPWDDIAYSFLVCRHGYVFVGRGWDKRTAAQGAANDNYLAICFLGGDSSGRDDVTSKGRQAISALIHAARGLFGPALEVVPHSVLRDTECPGDELRAYVELRGWEHEQPSDGLPSQLPTWLWTWERWRLANRNGTAAARPEGVPRVIPPWTWLWAKSFELRGHPQTESSNRPLQQHERR